LIFSLIENELVLYSAVCLLSYFIGDIPFAFIFTKLVKKADIRYIGEGNVGARNVLHTLGKSYGMLVPARNESENIERNIESLAKQDYPNFELIILDDNSEDDTLLNRSGTVFQKIPLVHLIILL